MRTSTIAVAVGLGLTQSTVSVTAMGTTENQSPDHGTAAVGDAPGLESTAKANPSFSKTGEVPVDGGSDAVTCLTGGSAYLGP